MSCEEIGYADEVEPGMEARAMAAYFRTYKKDGSTPLQPTRPDAVECNGKVYIILHNVNGLLSVYRWTNHGQLRRMKRPPKPIFEMYGEWVGGA